MCNKLNAYVKNGFNNSNFCILIKTKMTKRSRESTVSFGVVDGDGYIKVDYAGKSYAWYSDNSKELTDERVYECEIIHNMYGMAMISFKKSDTNEEVLRQEINPYNKKSTSDWVVDNQ